MRPHASVTAASATSPPTARSIRRAGARGASAMPQDASSRDGIAPPPNAQRTPAAIAARSTATTFTPHPISRADATTTVT